MALTTRRHVIACVAGIALVLVTADTLGVRTEDTLGVRTEDTLGVRTEDTLGVRTEDGRTGPQRGDRAPEISLPSIDAQADAPVRLSDHRGKVVFVDFWSAWCAPCRRDLPRLSDLRESLPRDEFEVLSINVDAEPADGRRFLGRVSVSYPVAVDTNGATADRFAVSLLPHGVIVDQEGVVQRVFRAEPRGGDTRSSASEDDKIRSIRAEVVRLIARNTVAETGRGWGDTTR